VRWSNQSLRDVGPSVLLGKSDRADTVIDTAASAAVEATAEGHSTRLPAPLLSPKCSALRCRANSSANGRKTLQPWRSNALMAAPATPVDAAGQPDQGTLAIWLISPNVIISVVSVPEHQTLADAGQDSRIVNRQSSRRTGD